MIRTMIVDDHQMLIDGLEMLLKREPGIEVVATVLNGQSALEKLAVHPADVVLLDVNMPEMDGMETCKLIKHKWPETQVIALTMHDEGQFITAMLNSGASGYVLKNTGKDELIEAIKAVHNGKTFFTKEVTESLMNSMIPGKEKGQKKYKPEISDREKEVLELIVQEFTTNEIAEKLFISQNTVESHRRHLLEKLGARNSAGLVRITMEFGLLES